MVNKRRDLPGAVPRLVEIGDLEVARDLDDIDAAAVCVVVEADAAVARFDARKCVVDPAGERVARVEPRGRDHGEVPADAAEVLAGTRFVQGRPLVGLAALLAPGVRDVSERGGAGGERSEQDMDMHWMAVDAGA